MKKSFIVLTALFFISFNSLSQNSINTNFMTAGGQKSGTYFGSNQMLDGGRFASVNSDINKSRIGIKGSPLLFNNFKNNGILKLTSGKLYKIKNINVDLDNGEFVSEIAKDSIFIFNNIKMANINSKVYTQNENKIYEILETGNRISLLKKISKVLKRQVQNKLTAETVKWKLTEDYFVKFNGNYEPINLKKKDFFRFIKDDKVKVLKEYIKSNRLVTKKEKDLIKTLKYYNNL